jgi:putative Ca2+/H+ antiporter (TMEM165/GDT1 family)
MEAFLTSAVLVALAEIGDKTQLLSFVLAARCASRARSSSAFSSPPSSTMPWPARSGVWLASLIPPHAAALGHRLLFVGFGLWTLHPDSLDDDPKLHRAGAFVTTTIAFFIAEMGDKTQLATVALAARFDALAAVVLGTTLGMLIANIPAVLVGEALAQKLPMKAIRLAAAAVFIATGR